MTLRRTAADSVARSLGISLGMPATKAQALVAKLIMQNADAEGDGASLYALIEKCCTARNKPRGAELAHGSRRCGIALRGNSHHVRCGSAKRAD